MLLNQHRAQRVQEVYGGNIADAEVLGDRRRYEGGVCYRAEINEGRPVAKAVRDRSGRLDRQAGLADSRRSRQCDEPNTRTQQKVCESGNFLLAA